MPGINRDHLGQENLTQWLDQVLAITKHGASRDEVSGHFGAADRLAGFIKVDDDFIGRIPGYERLSAGAGGQQEKLVAKTSLEQNVLVHRAIALASRDVARDAILLSDIQGFYGPAAEYGASEATLQEIYAFDAAHRAREAAIARGAAPAAAPAAPAELGDDAKKIAGQVKSLQKLFAKTLACIQEADLETHGEDGAHARKAMRDRASAEYRTFQANNPDVVPLPSFQRVLDLASQHYVEAQRRAAQEMLVGVADGARDFTELAAQRVTNVAYEDVSRTGLRTELATRYDTILDPALAGRDRGIAALQEGFRVAREDAFTGVKGECARHVDALRRAELGGGAAYRPGNNPARILPGVDRNRAGTNWHERKKYKTADQVQAQIREYTAAPDVESRAKIGAKLAKQWERAVKHFPLYERELRGSAELTAIDAVAAELRKPEIPAANLDALKKGRIGGEEFALFSDRIYEAYEVLNQAKEAAGRNRQIQHDKYHSYFRGNEANRSINFEVATRAVELSGICAVNSKYAGLRGELTRTLANSLNESDISSYLLDGNKKARDEFAKTMSDVLRGRVSDNTKSVEEAKTLLTDRDAASSYRDQASQWFEANKARLAKERDQEDKRLRKEEGNSVFKRPATWMKAGMGVAALVMGGPIGLALFGVALLIYGSKHGKSKRQKRDVAAKKHDADVANAQAMADALTEQGLVNAEAYKEKPEAAVDPADEGMLRDAVNGANRDVARDVVIETDGQVDENVVAVRMSADEADKLRLYFENDGQGIEVSPNPDGDGYYEVRYDGANEAKNIAGDPSEQGNLNHVAAQVKGILQKDRAMARLQESRAVNDQIRALNAAYREAQVAEQNAGAGDRRAVGGGVGR